MWVVKKFFYRVVQVITKQVVNRIKFKEPMLINNPDSLLMLPDKIGNDGLDKVMIVTDKVLLGLGLLDGLLAKMDESGISYVIYDGVKPNPTIENVESAHEIYIREGCKGIVAFGGGSSMDCAKGAGARISNPNKSIKKMKGLFKVRRRLPRLYAVPTTAGTGSETTVCAVITDTSTHEKFAVSDIKLVPDIAVLDANLTIGLPKHITSTTGMDALTHAVEAYIGNYGTKYTNKMSEVAVKLIFDNIENAYDNGSNLQARENMLLASYYAGIAFTRAYIGYVHAIAHNLGGLYGVPHGLANAVVLPYILEYYEDVIEKKLAQLAIAGGLGETSLGDDVLSDMFISKVKELNKVMNIPTYIKELKIKDVDLLAKRAMKEGNPEYPVPKIMSVSDCKVILEKLLPPKI